MSAGEQSAEIARPTCLLGEPGCDCATREASPHACYINHPQRGCAEAGCPDDQI